MPKYVVALGALGREVKIEANDPQQAMRNVVSLMEPQSIAMVPNKRKRETIWFARNPENAKDEFIISDTETAREFVSKVRQDSVEVFWFVELDESNKKTKIRK